MYGSKQLCDPEQDTVSNNTDLVAVLVFRLFVVLLASGFKRFKALHIQNKTINVPRSLAVLQFAASGFCQDPFGPLGDTLIVFKNIKKDLFEMFSRLVSAAEFTPCNPVVPGCH